MKFVIKAPAGQAADSAIEGAKLMATALTNAMREVGKIALTKGKASIADSGLGSRWVRSLKLLMRPKSGVSFDPSAYVHSTINFSDIFEHGGTIVGQPLLWLPLDNVPKINGRQLTPKQYVRKFGPLRTIRRKGRAPMLGAAVRVNVKPGKRVSKRALSGTISKRATSVIVPLYVGVPSVTLLKRFDVHGAAKEAFEQFGDIYKQKMDELIKANNGS